MGREEGYIRDCFSPPVSVTGAEGGEGRCIIRYSVLQRGCQPHHPGCYLCNHGLTKFWGPPSEKPKGEICSIDRATKKVPGFYLRGVF